MNPYFESEYRGSRMMHSCPGVIYVVKQGDTLYKISQYHHVSVTDILLANPYVNVYNLQIGDELCIPVGKMAMAGERGHEKFKVCYVDKVIADRYNQKIATIKVTTNSTRVTTNST